MQARLILFCCLLLSCAACKKNDTPVTPQPPPAKEVQAPAPSPALPLAAAPFLSQPLPTTVIETTGAALPGWRNFAKNRPALIIVANNPAMIPVPAEIRSEVDKLLKSGGDNELTSRTSIESTDPLLLPVMSLSAALDAGWFSQVLWVFPSKQLPEELKLATFQEQLVAAQIASPEEAASFKLHQGNFSGTLRGLPFTAAPAASLPSLEQSALLHIDADYFKPLYKGEIKTPVYPLMIELLEKIKAQGWKVAAATVALSNQGFESLPLQTRFLGKDLATILENPAIFDKAFPRQWELRGNALYLENFMQKEEIHKTYLEMEKADPADPDVKFGLYNISRQLNQTDKALAYLKEAVQIDPVYAQEYLSLAQLATEKNLPEKAVEMLLLARKAQPDNPFILTFTIQALLDTGHRHEAETLKKELAGLKWSNFYYPQQAEAQAALLQKLEEK